MNSGPNQYKWPRAGPCLEKMVVKDLLEGGRAEGGQGAGSASPAHGGANSEETESPEWKEGSEQGTVSPRAPRPKGSAAMRSAGLPCSTAGLRGQHTALQSRRRQVPLENVPRPTPR